MEWNVRIETASIDDAGHGIDELQISFAQLLDKLESYAAVGGIDATGWNVVVTIERSGELDHLEAVIEGRALILSTAESVGLFNCSSVVNSASWRVVEVCAVESELDWARNPLPTFPDVVGAQEVLAMLGVTKQRLSQLRQSGRFPEPMVELGATPVWLRSGIEGFLRSWDRSPGRPKAVVDQLAANEDLEAEVGNLGAGGLGGGRGT